jgi:putative glutamine amidotransferase
LNDRDTTPSSRVHEPWIAVVAQWRKGHARLPLPYVHAIELAGGRAKVLSGFDPNPNEEIPEGLEVIEGLDPLDPSALDGASGLLIPGGGDIDPELYGKTRHPRTHNVSQRRDRFELTLLGEALERDMPILAICHGMQLLNVCFGGTLVQHIADSPRRLNHDRDRPRAEPAHGLHLKEGSLLAEIFGSVSVQINSHHHQGLDGAAGPLEEIGWAEDGVLEAVVSREHSWVVGVQWHPEVMAPVDAGQRGLFDNFLQAVESYSAEASPPQARSA